MMGGVKWLRRCFFTFVQLFDKQTLDEDEPVSIGALL